MKIIIAPDSFKGSLRASEACKAIDAGVHCADQHIETRLLPLADGGEGTLDALAQAGHFERIAVPVHDPLSRLIEGCYLLDKQHAFIEMAVASGLGLLHPNERNCMDTTSYGTGELIADAVARGAKEVSLFVGGSATNDAGMGMAEALGFELLDATGKTLKGVGRNLNRLAKIRTTEKCDLLKRVSFHVITDVVNPLFGPMGAAAVYAPQKGASLSEVALLDAGLRQFASVVERSLSRNVAEIPGAGAAGGMGAAGIAFLNADLRSGTETIFDRLQISARLATCDLLITGEGCLDGQTLQGKLIWGLKRLADAHKVPVMVLCGQNKLSAEEQTQLGCYRVAAIRPLAKSSADAMKQADRYLQQLATQEVIHFLAGKGV